MKRIGYILIAVAMVVGVALRALAPENELEYAAAGLTLLFGSLILLIDGMISIFQSKVVLRPWDALKRFGVLFSALMLIHAIFVFFDWTTRSLQEAFLVNIVLAGGLALWATVYRKPLA